MSPASMDRIATRALAEIQTHVAAWLGEHVRPECTLRGHRVYSWPRAEGSQARTHGTLRALTRHIERCGVVGPISVGEETVRDLLVELGLAPAVSGKRAA